MCVCVCVCVLLGDLNHFLKDYPKSIKRVTHYGIHVPSPSILDMTALGKPEV